MSTKAAHILTNGNGSDLCVLLRGKILNMPTGIIPRHRAHQDRRVWLHLEMKKQTQYD